MIEAGSHHHVPGAWEPQSLDDFDLLFSTLCLDTPVFKGIKLWIDAFLFAHCMQAGIVRQLHNVTVPIATEQIIAS